MQSLRVYGLNTEGVGGEGTVESIHYVKGLAISGTYRGSANNWDYKMAKDTWKTKFLCRMWSIETETGKVETNTNI